MARRYRKTLSLCLKASALLVSLTSVYGRAFAGSCIPTGPGAYNCAGGAAGTDSTQNPPLGNPLVVTTSAGFGINTIATGGGAFRLYSNVGITFNDWNHSSITGATFGLLAVNLNSNDLAITSNGTITGVNGIGIWVDNRSTADDLTIAAAGVSGKDDGINALNSGRGRLSITTTGSVVGTDDQGIIATNSGTDLTISAADVFGGRTGISASNNGNGNLAITTAGSVAGGTGMGIWATNNGSGELSISTAGAVTGGDKGISASNSSNGRALIISAADVFGANTGISATNAGNGNLAITTAGSVAGGTGMGIWATNNGSGELSISTAGAVTGGDKGILASNSANGRALTILSNAGVNGGNTGIKANNQGSGQLQITSTGTVRGGSHGIYAVNQGGSNLSITTTGRVEGTTGNGLWIDNRSTGTDLTIATADVVGGNDGINATHSGSGDLSITTGGTIQGNTGTGIRADHNGDGSLSITTGSGTNVSGGFVGIWADNSVHGTDLTISTGNVTGNIAAIVGLNYGSGGLSITSSGVVTGNLYGIFAASSGGPTVINVSGQLLSHSGHAIVSQGAPATVNLLAGSNTIGNIYLTNGNDVTNLAGRLTGSVLMGSGNDTFTQVGGATLTGTVDGGSGIDTLSFNNMGTVNNNVIGASYINFENLGINGGNTILTGVWDFSGGATTISNGTLFLDGSLQTNTFGIHNGGYVNIAGTLNSSSVAVGGSMVVGGTVDTGAFTVNNGGYANIAGTLNSSSVTVGGSMDVGGTVDTGAFTVNNGGYANIAGILNSSSVTVDGSMDVNGTVTNTGAFMISNGGYANIAGLLHSNSVMVGGTMDIGGALVADSFTIAEDGAARITGNLNSETAAVFGGMNLNGSLTADTLTIASGGLLSGSGQINGSLVNHGTISPGNSIGTLRVDGSVRFMPGSIYLAEIGPDGASDRIDVSGPVRLNGGTVQTALSRSLYVDGQNWKLISAIGGITGKFDGLSCRIDSETVDLELAYSTREVLLEVVRTPFASFGLNPAGKAVGAGLDQVVPVAAGNMADFITAMDFDMSRSQIEDILTALSPEMYTSFSTAGLHSAGVFDLATARHQAEVRQGRALGLSSLADAPTEVGGGWTMWTQALGDWSERDAEAGYMGYSQDLGGLVTGAERQFTEVLRAGLDLGYTESDLEWNGTEHSGSIEGRHIGMYTSVELDNIYIDASVSYSDFSSDAHRIIAFGDFSSEAESGFEADVWAGKVEGGYNFTIDNWQLGPLASLHYARLSQDGFSEYGAGFLNLDIAGTDVESLTSALGFRFSRLIADGQWQCTPRLDLRWLHQFEDDAATVTANFTDYESETFDVTGIAPESEQGYLSLGMTGEYGKNLSLHVDYGITIADGYSSHLVSGGLSWKF